MLEFEWDEGKAKKNEEKHSISFDLAANLLIKQEYVEIPSNTNSETRFKAIGAIENTILTVVFTRRNARIRIISARRASREERKIHSSLFGK